MKIARTVAFGTLVLVIIAVAQIRDVGAGTKRSTIFVANGYDVTAYPVGSHGDVSPIAVTTDMAVPAGIARDASGRIYVTNPAHNTVTIYAANASGNVPPIAVIGGNSTLLARPTAIALDASEKIYVANNAGKSKSSITVYPPLETSTGILNEAPIAAIAGSQTLLDDPNGIAIDSVGNVYIANELGGPVKRRETSDRGTITVYSAGSNGNVAPILAISGAKSGLSFPLSIALDSSGNIYVANGGSPSINVYSAGSKGNAPPIAVIAGNNTGLGYSRGIALDASNNLYAEGYIENVGSSIVVYPAGSNGNVLPVATIAGADTGLDSPDGITLDSGGSLYVSNAYGGPTQLGSVTVYSAGSSADAAPIAAITSNFTGIDFALGIAADSGGKIYVTNQSGGPSGDGSVTVYSAGSYGTAPPIATIAGDNTGVFNPFGIALDSDRDIFVLNGYYAITVYPADSAGNVAPKATINIDTSGRNSPVGIAADAHGNLYVANEGDVSCSDRSCRRTGPDSVAVYRADSDGNAKPMAVISGPNTGLAFPSAVAVDHSGQIYVTNEGPEECGCRRGFCFCGFAGPGSITVYASGSNGDTMPVHTITGEKTGLGLPYRITLDSSGNIYVLNDGPGAVGVGLGGGHGSDGRKASLRVGIPVGFSFTERIVKVEPLLIFAAGSDGDVPPIGGIGGRFTGLDFYGSNGIAIGPDGP